MTEKIIIITGCSKIDGVGYNLAKELINQGHRVIATVRDPVNCDLKTSALAKNKKLDMRTLDLCDPESINHFTKNILSDYKYIDVLVNNAACVAVGPTESISATDAQTTFQTKVLGPLTLIQAFLPTMRDRKSGTITTTGSMFCNMPFIMPGLSVYLAALNALERIHESLASELLPWNINVFNFHPGPIRTNLTLFEGSNQKITEQYYKNFTTHAYSWFGEMDNWQSAADVAIPYAQAILSDRPDFHVYSSKQGQAFAQQYQADTSANSYRQQFIDYFHGLDYQSGDWQP